MQADQEDIKRLRAEFNKIDADGDGRVDKREMNQFLAEKGVDEDHRVEIIDELFNKCDVDRSGRIELDEFITHYVETKNQLVQTDIEHTQSIMVLHNEIVQMQQQLQQSKLVGGARPTTLKIFV